MRTRVSILACAFFILYRGDAAAQLFDNGEEPGVESVAVGPAKEGGSAPIMWACAGGPDLMMAVATEGGYVSAIGPGYFPDEPFRYPVATKSDFQAAAGGLGLGEIRALAASRDLSTLYAGFQKYGNAGTSGSPIFSLSLVGDVQVAVPVEELTEAFGEPASVVGLAVGAGSTLWVTCKGQDAHHTLLSIDLGGTPGQRIETVLTTPELEALLPVPEGTVVNNAYEWGAKMAADDSGRVFFVALVDIANELTASVTSMSVLRLDADGKVTALTDFEFSPIEETNSWGFFNYPAHGVWNGIDWDPDTSTIVGAGNGLWLIDPDVPGRHFPLLQPEIVQGIAAFISGDDWIHAPSGASGSCLARLEDGWFSTMMYSYFLFEYDLDHLDYDGDGLSGEQESLRGTDPEVFDTDGGGISDGLEVVDYTDPTDPSDDRVFQQPAAEWTMSPLFWGSAFQASLPSPELSMHTAVGSDGKLRMSTWNGTAAGTDVLVFESWDTPAQTTAQKAPEGPLVADGKGNLYGRGEQKPEGYVPLIRVASDGTQSEVFSHAGVAALVGNKSFPTSWAVDPLDRVWMGLDGGRILRTTPDGGAEMVYDGLADLVAIGYMEENGTTAEGACGVALAIHGMVFEPVRGIVYFALERDIACGGGSGSSPVVAAFLPDGRIVRVADIVDFVAATTLYGGGQVQDIAPDGSGGIYVLMAHGIDRSLTRIDATWKTHYIQMCLEPSQPGGDAMSWSLGHASNLTVMPDGRVFAIAATYYNQYPTYYGLVELKGVDRKVRGGDFLVVIPEDPFLGKLLADGGGVNLVRGEPLKRPTAVAATEETVVVSDPDQKGVIRFPVSPEGDLGEGEVVGSIPTPAGLDIDADGSILVCDVAGNRVVRILADGTQQDAASGPPLAAPTDVVATGGSGFVVASQAGGSLLFVDKDGAVTQLASVESPRSLALVPGRGIAVSSSNAGTAPAWIASDAASPALSDRFKIDLDLYGIPGGLAADSDGNLFWFYSTGNSTVLPVPFPGMSYVFRISTGGDLGMVSRRDTMYSQTGGDVCRVRGVGESLPSLGESLSPESGADASATGGDEASGDGGSSTESGSGGCSAAPGRSAAWPLFLFLLVGLILPLKTLRITRLASVTLLLAALLACSSPAGDAGDTAATPDDRGPSGWDGWDPGDFSVWVPEVVEEQCKGKSLCQPGSGPQCVDGASHHRCMVDEQGCWVWSQTVQCLANESCVDGQCQPPCAPECDPLQQCGDDGCGGSCGECAGPGDVCCAEYFCGPCVADCAGKECGHDGANGFCGQCPEGFVCGLGKCVKKETGTCRDWNQCSQACEEWNTLCWDDCKAWLDPWGQEVLASLAACAIIHCGDCPEGPEGQECFDDCLFGNCAMEFAECFAQSGTSTCKQIYECTSTCPPGDVSCTDPCYFAASPPYLFYAIEWEQCALPLCEDKAPGFELDQCLQEVSFGACKEQFTACMGSCSTDCGPKECGVNDCLFSCGECPQGQQCTEGLCK